MIARLKKQRATLLFPFFYGVILCCTVNSYAGAAQVVSTHDSLSENPSSNISSSDIALRLDKCRAQLRDIEKLRGSAQKLGHIELFEGLFSHAQRILDQIDSNSELSEIYLLLGECQGVLQSLEFSLNLNKYGKRKTHYGKGPNLLPSRPTKRQVATHAMTPEALPVFKKEENDDTLPEDRQTIIHIKSTLVKNAKGVYTKSVPSSGRRSSPRSTNDLNEALH